MSIILRIIVKDEAFDDPLYLLKKRKEELLSYLNNSMRHIADDWEIKVVDKETDMICDVELFPNQPSPPNSFRG